MINFTERKEPVIGMDNNIHYLSGAKGDVLYARSRCLKNGHTTIILEAEVTDDTGRLVAEMTGTAFKLKPAD
ncbi:MAG: PaaI family thioesterase [Lachnospiraceae bacterium]|nr:PaaI family thioesterase [Lachnospiraceae bacterium]MDY4165700.1 PaaI family thioesterase [Lachnospiraceae bacterium]